MVFQKITFME